jgi:lipoyl(octanoyl) transferase
MRRLQEWIASTCTELGIETEIRMGEELGLWIGNTKLAAFGVRVRKGVVFHGAALNVSNDLEIYKHFTPCGIKESRATRLAEHLPHITMAQVDAALAATLPVFLGE